MDDTQRADQVREALARAVATLGSFSAVARAGGASDSAPHMWRTRGRIPAEYCPGIERETRRAAGDKADPALVVTCEQLCPDVDWQTVRTNGAAVATEPAASA